MRGLHDTVDSGRNHVPGQTVTAGGAVASGDGWADGYTSGAGTEYFPISTPDVRLAVQARLARVVTRIL